MSKSITLIAFVLLSLFLSSTAQQRIKPDEFFQGLQNGDYDAVIDVRNEEDFLNGHIPGVTYIDGLPRMTLPPFQELLQEGCNNSEKVIVVYCYSGGRAASVIQKLIDAGYQATLLNGQGASQWTNAGYELVKSADSANPKCFQESRQDDSNTDIEPNTSSPVTIDVTDTSAAMSGGTKYWSFILVFFSLML